jgi:hypothetical protein
MPQLAIIYEHDTLVRIIHRFGILMVFGCVHVIVQGLEQASRVSNPLWLAINLGGNVELQNEITDCLAAYFGFSRK